MAQKRKTDQTKLIVAAALAQAGKTGWDGMTLQDVAKKAKVAPEAVTRLFPDTWAILLHVLKKLDADTAAGAKKSLSGSAWRDDLFEILMTRLELLEDNRAAFTGLLPALLRRPKAARRFARPFHDSMRGMLKQAGAPATPAHAALFGPVYLSIVEAWKNDDTPDLSRTMAVADRRLDVFEKIAAGPCGVRTAA